jgi:alcohol dehydrogenase
VARELGGTHCLLVADPGMVETGYVKEATRALRARRIEVFAFHDFEAGPTASMVEAARVFAERLGVNLIVGLGGGSSLDCAKAVNFVLTNGGVIRDYWGYGKASRPLLPMIGIPTTAGTGSEAQSDTLIADPETHVKMACGDPKAAFRVAILDPKLTLSQPASLAAESGYDAIAHAIESLVSTRRTPISECFSREAWRLLNGSYERMLREPGNLDARGAMLLGAHFAGLAVEHSTLAAAHACAAPLTAHYTVRHGAAMAMLLAPVVAWNSTPAALQNDARQNATREYDAALEYDAGREHDAAREYDAARQYRDLHAGDLRKRLRDLAQMAELPVSLREVPVPEEALPRLAEEAGTQWAGRFNPRSLNAAAALEIYQSAY